MTILKNKNEIDSEDFKNMNNDSNNWKGIFYVNRKDSRVIVPKLYPLLGYTLNFGNIYTYLAIATIVLIVVFLT